MIVQLPLTLEALHSQFKRLPGSPKAVQRVLDLVRRPDASVAAIARAVEADPDLTLRVLRTANSPFYGSRGGITSMRDACRVLGVHTLGNVATAVLAMTQFPATGEFADWRRELWRHGAGVGAIARALARHRRLSTDTAYTAGLLHDLGRMALQACFPQAFVAALQRRESTGSLLKDAERDTFGLDHCEVGAELTRMWQLPQAISNAIAQHHPGPESTANAFGDLIHIADILCKKFALGSSGEPRSDDLDPCVLARVGIAPEPFNAWLPELEAEAKAVLAEFDACGTG